MAVGAEGSWLLVSVSTAGAAASLRVHSWRRLRGLGALYVQQSVCLLPQNAGTAREVARLLDKLRRGGGEGRLLHIAISDPGEHAGLVAEMQTAIDEEYAEVLQRLPSFFGELAEESARGRATYAEVEESEADLERFRSWVAKIEARDYFASPGGEQVRAELARAGAALEAFEELAMSRDDLTPRTVRPRLLSPAPLTALHAVGDDPETR